MARTVKKIALVTIGIFLLYAIVVVTLPTESNGQRYKVIELESGEGIHDLAQKLATSGLVRSKRVFEWWAYMCGADDEVHGATTFMVPSGKSIFELCRSFTTKQYASNEVRITIPEGYTISDIAQLVNRVGLYTEKDFLDEVRSDEVFSYVGAARQNLFSGSLELKNFEGYLFPDTYLVYQQGKPRELVAKMLDNFSVQFSNEYLSRSAELKLSVHEVITMASILEREVRSSEDMALVADIFWRRLGVGMPLQADSTVNYVTGYSRPAVSLDDTKVSSPYNTYQNKGLPVGPISNPGQKAIQAALHPKKNPYWYFLTKPDGEVVFSLTYEDHLRAKKRYLGS